MKKITVFIIIIGFLSIVLFSAAYTGKGKLKGVVKDENGNPVEGVTVKLFSLKAASGFNVRTDKNGKWKAMWIRAGIWHIDFEKPGYESKKISVNVATYKTNPLVEIVLKKMEGVEISKDFIEKINKGNKLFEEKKYDEAIKLFEELIKEKPELKMINQNIGNCYFAMEKYEKAVEYYKKALKDKGDNTDMFIAIGNSYINMKNNEKALEWYKKADTSKIKDFNVLYNIGVIFYNNFNYKKALEFFKMAVDHNGDFADGWYQLGMTLVAVNKQKEAIDALNTFLKLAPDSPNAQTAKAIIDAFKKSK
jgi:tetratricopeptide (TPR) repeat protein